MNPVYTCPICGVDYCLIGDGEGQRIIREVCENCLEEVGEEACREMMRRSEREETRKHIAWAIKNGNEVSNEIRKEYGFPPKEDSHAA